MINTPKTQEETTSGCQCDTGCNCASGGCGMACGDACRCSFDTTSEMQIKLPESYTPKTPDKNFTREELIIRILDNKILAIEIIE